MSLSRFIWIGCTRNPIRFVLSLLGVATAVWGLALVRTASDLWHHAIEAAAEDTLIIRSALPQKPELPIAYAVALEKAEGEIEVLTLRYAVDLVQGNARPRRVMVETTQAESKRPASELFVPPRLVERYGLSGSDVALRSKQGTTPLKLASLGTVIRAPGYAFEKTECDEIKIKLRSKSLAEIVAKRVDSMFENERIPTMTQTEHAMQSELSRSLSSLFRLIDGLSVALLSIIAMVIAAMIGLATAERTTEYAVLRALGFAPAQILIIVCSEAVLTAALGASLGVVLALLSSRALGSALIVAMPDLAFDTAVSFTALGFGFAGACALALLSAIIPATTAARTIAAEALRKQES